MEAAVGFPLRCWLASGWRVPKWEGTLSPPFSSLDPASDSALGLLQGEGCRNGCLITPFLLLPSSTSSRKISLHGNTHRNSGFPPFSQNLPSSCQPLFRKQGLLLAAKVSSLQSTEFAWQSTFLPWIPYWGGPLTGKGGCGERLGTRPPPLHMPTPYPGLYMLKVLWAPAE